MLNSRQRAQLRGLANSLDPIFQIGKGSINDQLIRQIEETIDIRELIKITVLETCPKTARECADEISEMTGCDVVQVIGRKFVIYRRAAEKDNIKIILVK